MLSPTRPCWLFSGSLRSNCPRQAELKNRNVHHSARSRMVGEALSPESWQKRNSISSRPAALFIEHSDRFYAWRNSIICTKNLDEKPLLATSNRHCLFPRSETARFAKLKEISVSLRLCWLLFTIAPSEDERKKRDEKRKLIPFISGFNFSRFSSFSSETLTAERKEWKQYRSVKAVSRAVDSTEQLSSARNIQNSKTFLHIW